MTTHEELKIEIAERWSEILSHESKWSHVLIGEDAQGNEIAPDSPNCVKWSMMGALNFVWTDRMTCHAINGHAEAVENAYQEIYQLAVTLVMTMHPLRSSSTNYAVTRFNDHSDTTFSDVRIIINTVCAALGVRTRMYFDHTTASKELQ